MKKLFSVIAVFSLLISFNSFAKKPHEGTNIILSHCMNIGSGVSFSFQSCVNSNFSQIGRTLGGFFSHCMNIGNEVDYGFTSCVNSNFRTAERLLSNSVFLQDCYNFDRTTLDFSFVSCVNSNFNRISIETSR